VIAADGLSGIVEDDGTFKTTSCQVQKIFRLDAREKHLTCSLSGNADIRSDDGAVVAIDLIETIGSITKTLLAIDGVSLNAFMDGIARCLN
jgi:hypothetical protein